MNKSRIIISLLARTVVVLNYLLYGFMCIHTTGCRFAGLHGEVGVLAVVRTVDY